MTTDVSDFISQARIEPPAARLRLSGELDAFTAHQVSRQVVDAVGAGCTDIRLDLAGVTFIDAAGIGLLVRLRGTATEADGRFEVEAASDCVQRLCALLELTEAFGLRPDPCPTGSETGAVATLQRSRPRWRRRGIA